MSPESFLQTELRGTQRADGLSRDLQVERKDEITDCWILSRFCALPGLKSIPRFPCDFHGEVILAGARGNVSGSRPMILRGMHPGLSDMRHLIKK